MTNQILTFLLAKKGGHREETLGVCYNVSFLHSGFSQKQRESQTELPACLCKQVGGEERLDRKWLSGSVGSQQKPLPSWRDKPMIHLRLGARVREYRLEWDSRSASGPPCLPLPLLCPGEEAKSPSISSIGECFTLDLGVGQLVQQRKRGSQLSAN